MNIGRKQLTETDFLALWTSIDRELQKLSKENLCSASLVYSNIYIVCTSPTAKYEERLYWKIGDFIYSKAKSFRTEIFEADAWVEAYNAKFKRFRELVYAIDELCDFLNGCIKGRSIRDFGFMLWERCILQQTVKYKYTTLGFELVNHARVEDVRDALESLRLVVPDPKHPLLYYTQRYEQLALEKIKNRYEQEISSLGFDIVQYSEYVKQRMIHEKSIREQVFLEESFSKVESILEEVFILNRSKFLHDEIYRTLSEHELPVELLDSFSYGRPSAQVQNDFYALHTFGLAYDPKGTFRLTSPALESVAVLYQNLSWLASAYEILRLAFMKYIDAECEKNFELYGRDVESLYIFYCMIRRVVEVGFMGDHEFARAFKSKISSACTRLKPSLEARLIKFVDSIVTDDTTVFGFLSPILAGSHAQDSSALGMTCARPFTGEVELGEHSAAGASGGKKDQGEASVRPKQPNVSRLNEREVALQRVFIVLYKLIESKSTFYEMYLDALNKRLLKHSSSLSKERRLINLVRRKGNPDFIKKAETMVNDISISLQYNGDKDKFVWMLTRAYWPIKIEELNLKVPDPLQSVRRVYDMKFTKKKILWAWCLGTVSVDILGKETRMNIVQYTVLDLFNRCDVANVGLVAEETKLSTRIAENAMRSLLNAGMVERMGEDYRIAECLEDVPSDITSYFINTDVKAVQSVDECGYYQSLIAKILKKSRKLAMHEIHGMVEEEHTERFKCNSTRVEESVKVLIEKGIVEEINSTYFYCP
jgi:cullin 2